MSPYRQREEPSPASARTLECTIGDGDRYGWLRSLIVKAWLTIMGAVIVGSVAGSPLGAVVVAVLGLVWMANDFRRRHGTAVRMRIAQGRLSVSLPTPVDVPVGQLLDVRLDTKSTSKPLDAPRADGLNTMFGSAIPGGPSIEIDKSRIELVIEGAREPVPLTSDYVSNTLAIESLRSIKMFLRKAGWLPLEERPVEDDD